MVSLHEVFSSAGDLGDTIYQLPTMRQLAGGKPFELVLYSESSWHVRQAWTPESFERVRSFLQSQPYIKSVRFAAKPDGIVIDHWREGINNKLNLCDNVAEYWAVPPWPVSEPWAMATPNTYARFRYVLHRSPRYQNELFPWAEIVRRIGDDAVFVGSRQEYADFEQAFSGRVVNRIRYFPTPTIQDLAQVIAGCEMFIGNQSAPRAIAEALKKPVWLETGQPPNTFFARPDCHGIPVEWPIPVQDLAASRSLIDDDRLNVIRRLARSCANVPGDVAEVGVYRGGSAVVISKALPNKKVHLFDTFTGQPEDDEHPTGPHQKGDFADTNVSDVESFLTGCPVKFHVGRFPDTAPNDDQRYSFVHLDADTLQATVAGLTYFLPRLNKGGVMVFDDWEWERCPGVKEALAKFDITEPNQDVLKQCWIRKE
jgi:predicted O-methyltransferase YrrM